MLDTNRYVHGATSMERQFKIVGIVSYRSLPLQNEDRVLGNGVDMRNVGFPRLQHDIIHVSVPGADSRPNHEARILVNQRQPQTGVIAMKYSDRHLLFSF